MWKQLSMVTLFITACGGEDPPGFFSKTGYAIQWLSGEEEPTGGIRIEHAYGWEISVSDVDQSPWSDGASPKGEICNQDPALSLLVIEYPAGDSAGCSGRFVRLGTDADADGTVWDDELLLQKRLCATEDNHPVLGAGTEYRVYVGCTP